MSEEEIINNIKEQWQWCDNSTYKMALKGILDLYNKEKEKNKELEYSLKNNVVTKYCIRHKADDYESKGYIEIAGAMRVLLEERK